MAADVASSEAQLKKQLHVLIADDNRDAADSMAILLRLDGHQVHVVYTGSEALEAARTLRPQCALLDLGMPGMMGHEVARNLRAEPWAQTLLLVAITGWGQTREVEAALAAGFNFHFTKPIDPAALAAVLAAVG